MRATRISQTRVGKKRLERQFGQLALVPRLPPIPTRQVEAELQVDSEIYLKKIPLQKRIAILVGLARYGGVSIQVMKIPKLAETIRMRVGDSPIFQYRDIDTIGEFVEEKVYEVARHHELASGSAQVTSQQNE